MEKHITDPQMRTLLIIDDEADIREVIQQITSRSIGVNTVLAADGQDGLEAIRSMPFDCILCDIRMPKMSGLELLKQVRLTNNETPFIMLTGNDDQENIVVALRLGAYDFLSKPFNSEQLLEVLNRALEVGVRKKRVNDQLSAALARDGQNGIETKKKIEREQKLISLLKVVKPAK